VTCTFCLIDGATIYKYIFISFMKKKQIAFVNRNCATLALAPLYIFGEHFSFPLSVKFLLQRVSRTYAAEFLQCEVH